MPEGPSGRMRKLGGMDQQEPHHIAPQQSRPPIGAPEPGSGEATASRSRKFTIGLLWVIYAAHYLCRVNLAAAQKSLAADRGLSKQQLGALLSLLKVFYGSGQFINGHLADRLSPRRLIILGLTVSGIINLLFAHQEQFAWFAILWAANGYFQAFGWTSVVRLTANWFPPRLRETASGVLGTSYVMGSGLSWLLAGRLTQSLGWRYAFWSPAWLCFAVAALVAVCLRDRPDDAGATPSRPQASTGDCEVPPVLKRPNTRIALGSLAFANMCLLFGYHGILDWTPHYLAEVGGLGAGVAANRAFLLPLGGTLGCLALAVIARRHPGKLGLDRSVVVPLVLLAAMVLVFPTLSGRAPAAVPAALLAIGVFSSPPASVMACALPADLCGAEAAGAAAGLIDASGYAGSALSGWLSGQVMDRLGATRGPDAAWSVVWATWAAGVLLAAALIHTIAGRLRREETDAE